MENKKNFLQKSWQNLVMLIALIAMWWLTGISIWYAIIFLIFFWSRSQIQLKPASYRALSIAMLVLLLIALGNAAINKTLPRTASKKVPVWAFVDQTFSKGAPSETKVRAQDIFDQNYKDASEKVLQQFEVLVKQGKIEEADKLIRDFESKWTFKPYQKEGASGNYNTSQNQSSASSSSVSPDSPGVEMANTQNLTLYKGSWYVDVKGVSNNIVIKTKPGRKAYTIEPVNGVYDYQILPDGETLPIQAGPNVRLQDKPEPRFRIIYRGSQPKRFKIIVH